MWGWSHTQEAYELARKNLGKKSVKWLAEVYAEWNCKAIEEAETQLESELFNHDVVIDLPDELTTSPFSDGRYECFIKKAKDLLVKTGKDYLVEWIWEKASEQATCENGGYEPHMCPYGCHRVEW